MNDRTPPAWRSRPRPWAWETDAATSATTCTATFTLTIPGRRPYPLPCQAEPNHPGNHRHLAQSGVARVWRDTPAGGELVAKIRLDRP